MIVRALPLALVAVLAAGCSSMSGWSSTADKAALERRLLELERDAVRSRLEIERLQRRIAELETREPTAPAAARPGRSATPATAPAAPVRPTAHIEESELADEPRRGTGGSYERGLQHLRDGRPEAAETELLSFAAAQPDSDLADNAWFWIGESRLLRGDWTASLDAYRTTIDRYPEGNKVPDALLKMGHVLSLRGEHGPARETWSELVRRFPQTVAADDARRRLAGR
jgi:tol-pal system protein YbgF